MQVLEQCPAYTIAKMAQVSTSVSDLCFVSQLWRKQIRDGAGHVPDKSRNSYEDAKTWGSPFVRWNNVEIVSDRVASLEQEVKMAYLYGSDIWVKVQKGFEIFSTDGTVRKGDCNLGKELRYSTKHLFFKTNQGWNMVGCGGIIDGIFNPMTNLNSTVSQDFLDVESSDQQVLVLYYGRLILYNWVYDVVLSDDAVDQTMVTVNAHFTSDGRLIKACLTDSLRTRIWVIDFINKTFCNIDLGISCRTIVPLFHKNRLWVLDATSKRQMTFSIVDGTMTSVKDQSLDVEGSPVIKAFFDYSIQRMVIVSEGGNMDVGEITNKGCFDKCGTLNGTCPKFDVDRIISYPESLVIIGKHHMRHIKFSLNKKSHS